MIYPNAFDMTCGCVLLGGLQLAFLGGFYLSMRRGSLARRVPYHPKVSLLVACKDVPPEFDACIGSLLRQAYPGPVETVFIAASERDPAVARLRALTAGLDGARVVVTGAEAVRCGPKALSLLRGIEVAAPDSEVFAFADSDIIVAPDWLEGLVAALGDPAITVSGSSFLFVPGVPGFWGLLCMAAMGFGIVYAERTDCIMGASFAMRRSAVARLGLAELWSEVLNEDLPLSQRVRQRGGKVAFVGAALAASPCGAEARPFFSQFNKWILLYRVYNPVVWALGLADVSAKAAVLLWSLRPPVTWHLPALLAGFDALHLVLAFSIYERFVPRVFEGLHPGYRRHVRLLAAAMAPFVWACYCVNFLYSLTRNEVEWGGTVYRIRGPREVEAVVGK